MQNGVRIDSATIRQLSHNIISESETLLQMIEKARSKVADSEAIFDSPAAKEFRSKMEAFAQNAKEGASTSLTNLSNYFELVAKTYENTDQEVLDVANEFLTTDLFN